jgi:hypothetical protein
MNSLKTRNVRSLAVVVAVLGLFASTAHAQVTTLTNGVAVTGISGTAGSRERFYRSKCRPARMSWRSAPPAAPATSTCTCARLAADDDQL